MRIKGPIETSDLAPSLDLLPKRNAGLHMTGMIKRKAIRGMHWDLSQIKYSKVDNVRQKWPTHFIQQSSSNN